MLMIASTMATTNAGHFIFWIMPHSEKSSTPLAPLSPAASGVAWSKKKASLFPASHMFDRRSSICRNPPESILDDRTQGREHLTQSLKPKHSQVEVERDRADDFYGDAGQHSRRKLPTPRCCDSRILQQRMARYRASRDHAAPFVNRNLHHHRSANA